MTCRVAPIFAALMLLALLSPAAAQETMRVDVNAAKDTIRVDVNLVNLGFIARDSQGKLVPNLTADDIELFEDAVPQKIYSFARSTDLPLTLALIVDASGSQDHFGKQHQQDLEVFLKQVLRPQDRVFVVVFGNHLRLISDFTNSPAQVMDNYERYRKGKEKFPELGPKENRDLGTAFYDSIFYSVTEKLAQSPGRKAILMFSDGEDNSSSHNMMTTIETAQVGNVPIYAIRYTEMSHGKLNARNKYGISVMDRIAKESGGLHIDAEKTDPQEYFARIAEELRTSYEISYYPTNKAKDDIFRKVAIKPKIEGVAIRAKTGYFSRQTAGADAPTAPPPPTP
jgi:Ca-activated chloride channel homolog